ncbi:PDZ domain-containing protein [Geovibrio thiophilus]|uniref:PDZ domain-containing protein n=1 Tax=Geovibrio thiophilus TaxID=139438 RepID=A0A410K1G3_9BACT|nr:ChaN family lipoprotein [Geovibrio thiophilus]QAR34145.1 PDZ domain-containing protein [Geovibrio thiophilus]
MKRILILFCVFLSVNAFAANIYSLELTYSGTEVKGRAAWQSDSPAEFSSAGLDIKGAEVTDGSFTLPAGRSEISFEGAPHSIFGDWFPVPEEKAYVMLKVTVPKGYFPLFEGEETSEPFNNVYTFRSRGEVVKPDLVIVRDVSVKSVEAAGVAVRTAFSKKNAAFADEYIQKSIEYIKMYSEFIGGYPFKAFTAVEVPYPVGYAFEGFTTLGSAVIPLPFITETSLGHEILHQWFGGSVGIDYDKGNWAEGITTYMADYYYDELKWKGKEYRRNALISFAAYTDNETDFPLTEFRSRHGKTGSAVGYNKSMMFFHMLKRTYGNDKFLDAVRLFVKDNTGRRASWDDWRKAFVTVAGENAAQLFDTWITAKGLPEYSAEKIDIKSENGRYITSFNLVRKGGDFVADVPVSVKTITGQKDFILRSDNASKMFELATDTEPLSFAIDPYYDVPRMLYASEIPPVLATYIGASRKVFVTGAEGFDCLADVNGQGEVKRVPYEEFRLEDYKDYSVMLAGVPEGFYGKYFGRAPEKGAGLLVKAYKNPFSADNAVISVSGETEGLDGVCRRLPHYGKYSELVFVKGRNVKKETERTEDGVIYEIKNKEYAFRVSSAMSLEDIAAEAEGTRLIYIGENHDQHSHHAGQLAVIKLLHEKYGKIAIGMEMFQRPFQKVLDDYIEGVIDERMMLKQTEYYKRWRYDYHLYKPILTYAREHGIRVVALNAPMEATKKTASDGLFTLSAAEREHTASELDYTDPDYREDLRWVYNMHPSRQVFENFLEAQLLWDETMAETVADYIKNNDGIMVVLAGNGHIRRGYGVPDRVKRRNGLKYISIVQDESAEKGIADFVLYPGRLDGASAPKLGVGVKDPEVSPEVTEVGDDTPAKKAGLKAGDVIIGIDFFEVSSLEDLKIALFYMKQGNTVSLKIRRDGKEMTVDMEL